MNIPSPENQTLQRFLPIESLPFSSSMAQRVSQAAPHFAVAPLATMQRWQSMAGI